MTHKNRLCHISKSSWNWIVRKPQTNCIKRLWRNKQHNKTQQEPKQLATTAKSQVTMETTAVHSNDKMTKPEVTRIVPTKRTIIKVVKQTPTPKIKLPTIRTQTTLLIKETEDLDLSAHPVRRVVKLTIPQINVTVEKTQRTDRLPRTDDRKDKTKSNRKYPKQLRWECSRCSPSSELEMPHLRSGAACDRPETTEIPKIPRTPEVVRQQPTETITNQYNLKNSSNLSPKYCTQENSKRSVANQPSPPKGNKAQNSLVATKHTPGNQRGNEPVPLPNCSKNRTNDI